MLANNYPDWVELQPGRDVLIDGAVSSYDTVRIWSSQERADKGIKTIVDDPIPEGKVATGSSLVDDAGTPRRVWVLVDAPEPVEPDPVPTIYAAARLKIENGDVTGINVNSRLAGAFLLDVGKICVFFATPLPDTTYMVNCNDGRRSAQVLDEDKATDLFVITVTDAAGEPTDAEFVNIIIVRAS